MQPLKLMVLAGVIAPLLPVAAATTQWRANVRGPRGFVLSWVVIGILVDALMFANRRPGNILFYNLALPASGALILWGLSGWQTREVARMTLRIAAPAFMVIAAALLVIPGQLGRTDSMAAEVYLFLALSASVWTLVTRGTTSIEPLLTQDWFWICGGLTLYFGENATLNVAVATLDPASPQVLWAYAIESVGDFIALAAVARGLMCRVPSSSSSSLPSSVWPSS